MHYLILLVIPAIIVWVVPIYVTYEQGRVKNRFGLMWGLCLGWLGVLALAALPPADEA